MANVLFTRKDAPSLSQSQSVPIQDGQLLFDTSGSGKMYMDVGSTRLEMGGAMTIDDKLNSTSTNPIQNKAVGGVMLSTLDEINTATSKGFITDALATKALAQKIGTTDISAIGDGTCTGAISALNSSLAEDSIIKEYPVDITIAAKDSSNLYNIPQIEGYVLSSCNLEYLTVTSNNIIISAPIRIYQTNVYRIMAYNLSSNANKLKGSIFAIFQKK